MTRKQLQSLISAGVFSAALLSGVAYADDSGSTTNSNASQQAPATDAQKPSSDKDDSSQAKSDTSNQQDAKQDVKHTTKTDKDAADQGCSKASGCGGH